MSGQNEYKEPLSLSMTMPMDDRNASSENAATATPEEASIPMDDGRLNELGSITSGAIHAESSVSFTHASLSGSMQQLIDDINAKRKEDDHLVENYKKASEMHVQKTCELLEQAMFDIYEKQGKVIQAKLHEHVTALSRIAQLEGELQEFKQMLGMLYQDVHKDK